MHRVILIGALLMTVGLVAIAPTASASDMCGTQLPGGAHIDHICLPDPKPVLRDPVEWLREELACTCPPIQ
jgi:hypothetical protein